MAERPDREALNPGEIAPVRRAEGAARRFSDE
jgi:hypothetical protein